MTWFYIILFLVSCVVLVRSGVWVLRSLIQVARFLKWKKFVVSSILMALSTSLPEIFVGVSSAFHHQPELSFGMVIGSNIAALTLVVGLATILSKRELKFRGKTLQRSSSYAGIYGLLPLLLMSDGYVSRSDGILLLLALLFYFERLISEEDRFSQVFNHFSTNWIHFKVFLQSLLSFFLGVIVLLLSSEGIVISALRLASSFDVSLVVLGAILVSIGTSLPELTFGIRSITMNQESMILGDVMGSVVINSTFVLGISSIISPLVITNFSPYVRGFIFTVATCLFFVVFSTTDRKITKKEAFFLLGIYFLFLLTEIPF